MVGNTPDRMGGERARSSPIPTCRVLNAGGEMLHPIHWKKRFGLVGVRVCAIASPGQSTPPTLSGCAAEVVMCRTCDEKKTVILRDLSDKGPGVILKDLSDPPAQKADRTPEELVKLAFSRLLTHFNESANKISYPESPTSDGTFEWSIGQDEDPYEDVKLTGTIEVILGDDSEEDTADHELVIFVCLVNAEEELFEDYATVFVPAGQGLVDNDAFNELDATINVLRQEIDRQINLARKKLRAFEALA